MSENKPVSAETKSTHLSSGQRQLTKKEQRNLNTNHKGMFERMSASEIVFKIISYVLLTLFALICLYPFVFSISASMTSPDSLIDGTMVLFPVGFQFDAIVDVVMDKSFWMMYTNTLFVTLYGTVYMMVITIFAAYALAKTNLFGNKVFNFLLVFTMWFSAGMIPTKLNYDATKQIFSQIGIVDTKWVIVLAMGSSAFNIIIMRNAFQGVPKEIEEAAVVDGANNNQILWKVFVPMSKASVATVALFYGVSRWNGYFWAKQEADSNYDIPLQVYIRNWIEDQNNSDTYVTWWNTHSYSPDSYMYAMIVMAIIPILIIYPFIQKYFAAGVNLGGVKE
jgi:putative aldouronate transport system permease protein